MKPLILCSILCLYLLGCNDSQKMNYPNSKKIDHQDLYFDHNISDPFRWLEDLESQETQQWVDSQQTFTQNYLSKIKVKPKLYKLLKSISSYEKQYRPFKAGKYRYYFKNTGLQNHAVLYQEQVNGKANVFLDPNLFSKDGTASLTRFAFSEDGTKFAYLVSESGSDWNKLYIINVSDKKMIDQPISQVKFSGLSWYKNEGLYYSKYPDKNQASFSKKLDKHLVYYHKLGTSPQEDNVVFGEKDSYRYIYATVSDNQKYLIINAAHSTSGEEVYIKPLKSKREKFYKLVKGFSSDYQFIDATENNVFFLTNNQAPNYKLVKLSLENFGQPKWVDVIKEDAYPLKISKGANYFFAHYIKDVESLIKQFDYEGNWIRNVDLLEEGTVSGFSGKSSDPLLFYSVTNYYSPNQIVSYDPATGKSKLHWQPKLSFDSAKYESKKLFYRSADGTKIPLIITYKKGMNFDGNKPLLLYGYGGFNISLRPSFNTFAASWLKIGGIYAVANIRGGGEYGKTWHKAGTKQQKHNVFDDFIAAAEYLIEEGYTQSSKLAIQGGSNGGLLVATVMNRRPDLMRVVLPDVGVLDMLRYQYFSAGAGWAYDYGLSSDSEAMFKYLKSYSPYHNINPLAQYPSVLISTSDHDDRVVPSHSYKFAARLQQEAASTKNPLLIRIERNAGHGSGVPLSKRLEKSADILSFIWHEMDLESSLILE